MTKILQTVKERPSTTQAKKFLLDQITAYIDANLAEKITLKMIAGQFSVSVSTVTRLFQQKARITFHQFLTSRRMGRARTLILQGTPLEMVGRAIGYRDHSTFYRAFRQTFGLSPREYRKSMILEATE